MISGHAISEAPLSTTREGLPFGAFLRGTAAVAGTPSLVRVSSAALQGSAVMSARIQIVVFASAALVASATLTGKPNFVVYASTREFISQPTDQISNQPFFGTLQSSIQFDRTIVNGNGFGQATLGWGELALINEDGGYDYLIAGYAADGRRAVIRIGEGAVYNNFFAVFDGIATGIKVEEDVLRVFIRDGTYKLEVPVQASSYGGNGGLDGTSDLKGKRKPKAFGWCNNVTPALVNPTSKLFQVHDGRVQAISAVYNRGASVTFDQDYTTPIALIGATVPGGKYATCLAAGLFRVNFVLEGEVTADVQGDVAGGVFVSTAADIVRRIVGRVSSVNDPADLDPATFVATNAQQSAPLGYYVDTSSNTSVADAVADIMGSVGGYGGFRRDNKFEVGLFRAPSGVPVARYSRIDIVSIDRQQLPAGVYPQPYRYRVAWGRNYTTQTDLAGSIVDPARIAFLSEQYRLAEVADSSILIDHPLAQDPGPIEAYFRDEADATAEGARLLNLFGLSSNSLYQITLQNRLFVHEIGDVIQMTYPRWDLKIGRLLRIVSISEKTETGQTQIVGFG